MADLSPYLASYMPRFIHIESGGNPLARTGSYSGLLQMGPDEIRRYGGNGLAQGTQMYADRANWFANKYGRQPTPTELYLTNQQGEGGIAAHLANPDAPAWQNMYSTAEGQQKGPGWAKRAIWGNVPDTLKAQYPGGVDDLTSAQFMDLWRHKVEGTPLPTSPPASIPLRPTVPTGPQEPGGTAMPDSVWRQANAMSGSSPMLAGFNGGILGMLSGAPSQAYASAAPQSLAGSVAPPPPTLQQPSPDRLAAAALGVGQMPQWWFDRQNTMGG